MLEGLVVLVVRGEELDGVRTVLQSHGLDLIAVVDCVAGAMFGDFEFLVFVAEQNDELGGPPAEASESAFALDQLTA